VCISWAQCALLVCPLLPGLFVSCARCCAPSTAAATAATVASCTRCGCNDSSGGRDVRRPAGLAHGTATVAGPAAPSPAAATCACVVDPSMGSIYCVMLVPLGQRGRRDPRPDRPRRSVRSMLSHVVRPRGYCGAHPEPASMHGTVISLMELMSRRVRSDAHRIGAPLVHTYAQTRRHNASTMYVVVYCGTLCCCYELADIYANHAMHRYITVSDSCDG
jgi:hypothetical protein